MSFDENARILGDADHTFFVGIRSDPFFFDLEGFKNGMEFTGEDFFTDKNVFSIVLEIPNATLGTGEVGFWCRVLGSNEDGALSQIDRMGRPLINILYNEDEDKDTFNHVDPDQDRDLFLEKFAAVLEHNGRCSEDARAVAETLLPGVLTYDYRSSAGFPNGRTLDDDIINAARDLFTNGRISSDGVPAHEDLLSSFPYLGAPHATPVQAMGDDA